VAGRKVFTSGEILTAADVNSFLMDQSVMVFADSTARSSAIPSPSEGMVTYVEDANRVEVFDGSAFGAIGGILQVVSTTKTDTFSSSVSGESFTSNVTGLEATITPSSTSSKIFVLISVNGVDIGREAPITGFRAMRDATPISIGTSVSSRSALTAYSFIFEVNSLSITSVSTQFLDNPTTTSAVTYGLQLFNTSANTRTLGLNRSAGDSDAAGSVRPVSNITLMEVAV